MSELGKGSRADLILKAVALVVAVGLGGVVGYVLADDSSTVEDLESELADANQQRDSESARADELSQQLLEGDRDLRELEKKLSEQHAAGPAEPKPSPAPEGLLEIGEPGVVGPMTITPTSFAQITSDSDTTVYEAVISVENTGSEGVNPFCGEEGSLVDTAGRTFDPDSDLDFNSSNCGDDIQPGLSQSDYRLKFTVPGDAKPSILSLWGDLGYEDSPRLWNVKGI